MVEYKHKGKGNAQGAEHERDMISVKKASEKSGLSVATIYRFMRFGLKEKT